MAKKRQRPKNIVTRGEQVRRKEFLQAEAFAKETRGTGRSAQTQAAADSARAALLRQQKETAGRVRRGEAVRPTRAQQAAKRKRRDRRLEPSR